MNDIKIIILISAFLSFYIWEKLFSYYKQEKIIYHDLRNIFLMVFNSFLLLFFSSLAKNITSNNYSLLNIDYDNVFIFVSGLLFLDFWTYWWHRLNHRIGFLWRFHRVHHMDKEMNVTTALRFHTGEFLLSFILRLMLIMGLGLSYKLIVIYDILLNVSVNFHHSNIKINNRFDSILQFLVVSPNMHKVHHSIKYSENNSNFSSLLSVWDKVFKSYKQNKPVTKIKYGLKEYNNQEDSLLKTILNPFKG